MPCRLPTLNCALLECMLHVWVDAQELLGRVDSRMIKRRQGCARVQAGAGSGCHWVITHVTGASPQTEGAVASGFADLGRKVVPGRLLCQSRKKC